MNRISAKNKHIRAVRRRDFVAGAVTAAATATLVSPAAVRGDSANAKVEIGVIGQGGRGRWISGLFAQHPGYKIVAVADYFPHVANAGGDSLGVDKNRRYSGLLAYQRLIDSKVDAVILETPPWVFPEHARAALAAGRHVYVAKPVACDVPGCLAIADLGKKATQSRKVFLVDFQIRTDPNWQECVKRAHAGALGKIALVASHYFAKRNIATFHKSITEGIYDNPTVEPSVNSTLTCILGREAGLTGAKVTWSDMLRAAKKIEVDTTGLTL